jgi:hypothetical protein
MAKAWRKHNMELATKIADIDEKIRFELLWEDGKSSEAIKKLQEKQEKLAGLRLRNKTERRMQYAAEVSQPSLLLFALFHNIGLPVPSELANNLNGKTISI